MSRDLDQARNESIDLSFAILRLQGLWIWNSIRDDRMKYKLLPTWHLVMKHAKQVENLFRKIETAGSPPTGVAGTRIARAFRSEIDKKSKHMIAEWRKKIEKKYDQQKKTMLKAALKGIRKSYDSRIFEKKHWLKFNKYNFSEQLVESYRKIIANLEREKELRIKKEPENLSKKFDQVFKVKIDAEVEQFTRKLAPRGFHFRLKYAFDTYGGKAYAGSMVLAADPKGRGEWRKMGSMTAPTKK